MNCHLKELVKVIGQSSTRVVRAKSGIAYAVDVKLNWNNQECDSVLVAGMVAVADCGPLQRLDESFVISRPEELNHW